MTAGGCVGSLNLGLYHCSCVSGEDSLLAAMSRELQTQWISFLLIKKGVNTLWQLLHLWWSPLYLDFQPVFFKCGHTGIRPRGIHRRDFRSSINAAFTKLFWFIVLEILNNQVYMWENVSWTECSCSSLAVWFVFNCSLVFCKHSKMVCFPIKVWF